MVFIVSVTGSFFPNVDTTLYNKRQLAIELIVRCLPAIASGPYKLRRSCRQQKGRKLVKASVRVSANSAINISSANFPSQYIAMYIIVPNPSRPENSLAAGF